MPDYQYECLDCKEIFTVHLTMSEHEESRAVPCERCGSRNVRQLLSGPTVITSKKS